MDSVHFFITMDSINTFCMSNLITCPNCNHQFSLDEVQQHKFEEKQKQLEEAMQIELAKKEELIKREMWIKAQAAAEKKFSEENKEKLVELESLKKFELEARAKEMESLRKIQEYEQIQKNLPIEIEKAKMEERKKVEEESRKQAEERTKFDVEKIKLEYEKRESELQKKLEISQKSSEELTRKLSQWSTQIQWEVQEDALKELLISSFPIDIISDVEKWIKWADIIQEVRNEFGQSIGIIAWESKNTRVWDDKWIGKLKEDRLRVNASLSVIVSSVLPKWIEKFWLYDGIWVIDWKYLREVAIVLRSQLIELKQMQNSIIWRDEKLEVVFNYLTSSRFKDKIENIITAFQEMQEQIQKERAVFEAQWKKREWILWKVLSNTSWLYGDLGGILGSKLEKVEYLELWNGV